VLALHVTLGVEDILFHEERRVVFRPCVRIGVGGGSLSLADDEGVRDRLAISHLYVHYR